MGEKGVPDMTDLRDAALYNVGITVTQTRRFVGAHIVKVGTGGEGEEGRDGVQICGRSRYLMNNAG
jgi:hypothetical protein